MPYDYDFFKRFFEVSRYALRKIKDATKKIMPSNKNMMKTKTDGFLRSGRGCLSLYIYPKMVIIRTIMEITKLKMIVVPSNILVVL